MNASAAPFCRHVLDYSGLVNAVRDRSEQMEMSRHELDHIAGLTQGHADKILRPRPEKKLGKASRSNCSVIGSTPQPARIC